MRAGRPSRASGDGTWICDNTVVQREGSGVVVSADSAVIERNLFGGRHSSTSVRVVGNDVTVASNDIVQHGHTHTPFEGHGIDILGDDAHVSDNSIYGTRSHGVVVEGVGGQLSGNDIRDASGHGIALIGGEHCVEDTTVTGTGIDGIVVYAENVDVRNTIIRGAGRFGICFEPGSDAGHVGGTGIHGAARGGLLNAATGTTIEGSTLSGNSPVDLLVLEPLGGFIDSHSGRTSDDPGLVPTEGDGWFAERLGQGVESPGRSVEFGTESGVTWIVRDDRAINVVGWDITEGKMSGDDYHAIWEWITSHNLAGSSSGTPEARVRRCVTLRSAGSYRRHYVHEGADGVAELYEMLERARLAARD